MLLGFVTLAGSNVLDARGVMPGGVGKLSISVTGSPVRRQRALTLAFGMAPRARHGAVCPERRCILVAAPRHGGTASALSIPHTQAIGG